MNETAIKIKAMKWIRDQGGCCIKVSDRFTSGIPDLWACIDGHACWIELKTPMGRLSKIQKWQIKTIKEAGGEVHVCKSVEEVKAIFM